METVAKIEPIDVEQDSDLLLNTLMQARLLLKKVQEYRKLLFWAVIALFLVQLLGAFLKYLVYSDIWLLDWFLAIPAAFTLYFIFGLKKKIKDADKLFDKCASIASKIAQNLEKNQHKDKNYILPKYAIKAIDIYEDDADDKDITFSGLRNTLSITSVILTMSVLSHFFYGMILFSQKNEIDFLKNVNQQLIKEKKVLKNK